jgi:hypothetical protein
MQLRTSLRTLAVSCVEEFEIEAGDQPADRLGWLGRYPGVAVALSLVACYGTLALVAVLSLAGISISIREGVWAAVIVVLAWIAVLALGVNVQRHRSLGPFIIGDVGALIVSWVMLVDFSRPMELLGFALLVVAALWDGKLRKQGPSTLPDSRQGSE